MDPPCDPLPAFTGQPQTRRGHVLWLTDPLERETLGDLLLERIERCAHHLGAERTEGEGVDCDGGTDAGREVAGESAGVTGVSGISGRIWRGGAGKGRGDTDVDNGLEREAIRDTTHWCRAALDAEYANVSIPGTLTPLIDPI